MTATSDAPTLPPIEDLRPEDPATAPRPLSTLPARLIAAGALSVAVLAGMASLTGVVEGGAWFPALVPAVLGIHFAAALVRTVRPLRWLAVPVGLIIAVFVGLQHPIMELRLPGQPLHEWVGAALYEASMQLATQVPPVAYSRYVAFLVFILAMVVSLLVELLISFRQLALLAIAALSFAPVIASLFKQEGAGIGFLVVIVAAVLVFVAILPYLYQPARSGSLPSPRHMSFLGWTTLICIAAMLISSMWMPGFRKGMFPEGIRPSGDLLASNVDPLINLGRDLRANNGSTVLKYLTTSEQAPYLRTEVIDDLSTARWEPSENWLTATKHGTDSMNGQFLTVNSRTEVLRLEWPEGPDAPVLPLPAHSYLVDGVHGDWTWTAESAVARLTGDAMANTNNVSVAYSEMNLSREMARNLGFGNATRPFEPVQRYRALPEDPDGTLQAALHTALDEAFDAADDVDSDFEKAVAIQDYLRSSSFGYSVRTPLREGYDGANKRVVEAFLERRQGYCVHFASTMALMARAVNIPSRIAVGYAPGKATGESTTLSGDTALNELERNLPPKTEFTEYAVTGQQAHAWPELFLPGLGWTAFEPTPGQGRAPSYAPEPTSESTDEPLAEEEFPLDRSTQRPVDDTDDTVQSPEDAAVDDQRGSPWLLAPVVLLVVVAALAVAPYRRYRRRQALREQLAQAGPDAAGALWSQLQQSGADYAHPCTDQESVADYTRRLALAHPRVAEQLAEIREVVQLSFYAARPMEHAAAEHLQRCVDEVELQLVRSLTRPVRFRSTLFPASLRSSRPTSATAVKVTQGQG